MGKSGSSAIQKRLAQDRAGLLNHGILIPQTDSHIFLGIWTNSFNNIPRALKPLCPTENDLEKLRKTLLDQIEKEIARQNAHTIILSSEYIFAGDISNIQRVFALETLLTAKIKPIVYMRDPVSYYLSYVQQVGKNTCAIPQPSQFEYPFVQYLDELERLSSHKPIIRCYDRSLFPNADVYEDFANAIGIGSLINKNLPESEVNESLSAEYMLLIRDFIQTNYNGNLPNEPLIPIEILLKVMNNEGTKPTIKTTVHDFLFHRFQNELKRLSKKYDISFQNNNYDTPINLDVGSELQLEDILESYDKKLYNKLCHKALYSLIKYIPYKLAY